MLKRVTSAAVACACLLSAPEAYSAPGDLDDAFSGAGVVRARAFDRLTAVAGSPNGAVVVAGRTGGPNADGVIARYRADGVLDSSFDGNGVAQISLGGDERLSQVVAEPDGAVVVGGWKDEEGLIARLTPAGQLDPSFGVAGMVLDPGLAKVFGLARDSAGRIVAVGRDTRSGLSAVRYLSNGSRDRSFGEDGVRAVPVASGPGLTKAAVAVANDDSLIVGADELARLTPRGEIDPGFTSQEFLSITDAQVHSIALEPGGSIIAGGRACGFYGCSDFRARVSSNGDSIEVHESGLTHVAVASGGAAYAAGTASPGVLRLPPTLALSQIVDSGKAGQSFGIGGIGLGYVGLRTAKTADLALGGDGATAMVVGNRARGAPVIARFDLTAGPADTDADGVLDRKDRCLAGFATARSGCRRAARSVSIEPYRQGRLSVAVDSVTEACEMDVRVRLFARGPGPDRRVDHKRIRHPDGYARFQVREGTAYYAAVEGDFSGLARCRAAKSEAIRLP